jgi:crotonobetainyl-CoA:carnitine CoA-transferase CaiB-like acyl-CoA transferase
MTEAEEFRGDSSLDLLTNRIDLRERLDRVCGPWLRAHTVDEVLAEASKRQIPCAPVGNGATLLEMEHFRERKSFVASGDGTFTRPASPVLLSGDRISAAKRGPLGSWAGLQTAAPLVTERPEEASNLPLSGVRVLDLSAFWAGPGCAQILGHLGADVYKVEGAGRPDGMRLVAARGRGIEGWWEYNGINQGANSGKRCISIDLAVDGGRELLFKMCESADIVVENYPADVMDRLGITYDELNRRNPRIIMARMPAFGLQGPWRGNRGYAATMDQVSGISWVTGERDGPPVAARSFGDLYGSGHAAFGVLLALAQRVATGCGSLVESSLAEASLTATAEQVIEFSGAGVLLTRDGSRRRDAAPQGIYRAGDDSWIAISVAGDAQWQAFVGEVLPSFVDVDSRFASHYQRLDATAELDLILDEAFSKLSPDEALDRLHSVGIAAEPVLSPSKMDVDRDLVGSGYVRTLEHPLHGPLNYVTLPFTIGLLRPGPLLPAPMFGEHNEMIAQLAGIDPAAVDLLRLQGVIADAPTFVSRRSDAVKSSTAG